MITAEQIRRLAPRARQDYVEALVNGDETFERWGINTPLRLAAFLATVCHETGDLTIVRENTGWTKQNLSIFSKETAAKIRPFVGNAKKEANAAYGFRMGNERNGTNDDDGWRYRGGGLIQLTGRDNFERAGKAIGVDLGTKPELIEDATIALQAACWEFSRLVSYCDMGERGWKAVCNGINRGNALSALDPIGWSDRQIRYQRCCDALGITGKTADDMLRVGDQGALVKAIQERLTALGYAAGRADGVYGSRTRAAVLAFQAENHLKTDGLLGPETRNALNSESAVPMPVGERGTETAADLKAAGSETVSNAQNIKSAAKGIGAVSVVLGAGQQASMGSPDLISQTKDVVTEIGSWKMITNAMAETFAWATSHIWVLGIVAAFCFYRWGRNIEWRRVLDHNLGLHLGK